MEVYVPTNSAVFSESEFIVDAKVQIITSP